MIEMISDNFRALIKEMRTTKFKKIKLELWNHKGGYCLMGLACRLYSKANNISLSKVIDLGTTENKAPDEVIKWLWISIVEAASLYRLNDKNNLSFAQMADFIENSDPMN